jgi:hypothetical protein
LLLVAFVAFAIVVSSLSFTVENLRVPEIGNVVLPAASGNGTMPPLPSATLRNYWNSSAVRGFVTEGADYGDIFVTLASIFWNTLLALTIGASAFGLLYLISTGRLTRKRLPPVHEIEEQIEELRKIIDRTIYSLNEYSGYRKTIIDCYRAIVSLLGEAGWSDEASFTPREFENKVRTNLGVSSKYLHELTRLFEFARYGIEELSPQQAEEARTCLSGLSSELTANPGLSTHNSPALGGG